MTFSTSAAKNKPVLLEPRLKLLEPYAPASLRTLAGTVQQHCNIMGRRGLALLALLALAAIFPPAAAQPE